MKLLTQNGQKCLLYSAAMVLDIDPIELEKLIGHDGQEVVFPGHKYPNCLRGHHMQEIQSAAMRLGKAFILFEIMPRSGPQSGTTEYITIYGMSQALKRLEKIIWGRPAILVGKTMKSNLNHVYAWDGKKVFDPNGQILNLDDPPLQEVWFLTNWN